MRDDAELLRCYVEERSEAAFAELVQRHLGLVYQAARRQVGGDAHLAQDVAQVVFTDLARKARALSGRTVLAGWLYTSTRFAAAQTVRSERRRRLREDEARRMNDVFQKVDPAGDGAGADDWERLRPVIDDALHALAERDREAVLLRFFEARPFAEVGARLAVSEDAARMRVERALEKLRGLLARRGMKSTSAALAVALANPAWAAVPTGLAASIAGVALAGATTVAGAGAWVAFMGMTKLQIAFAGLIVAGGTSGFLVQEKVNTALRAERTRLQAESTGVDGLREEARAIGRVAADVREWRKDDVELARLAEGAAILRKRLEKEARAKAAAVAAQSRLVDQKPVLKMSEVDQLPEMIGQRAVPKYPKDFRQAGLGGEAIIRFVVDARGQVRDVEVKQASHDAFADAAVAAVKSWVFEAAKKGNVPVNVQMAVPIVFTLDEADGRDRTWF